MHFGDSFHYDPKLEYGFGDGSINERSLLRFREWNHDPKQKKYKLYEKELNGVNHLDILKVKESINYILSQLNVASGFPRSNEHFEHLNMTTIQIL